VAQTENNEEYERITYRTPVLPW